MRRLLLGLYLSVTMWGCAGHIPPNATPQMKVAIYADDAMQGVREVQRLTIALEAAGVVTTDQAAEVLIVAHRIGQGGEMLAHSLTAYGAAVDLATKRLALADVLATLDLLDAELKTLLAPLDMSDAKGRYLDTVVGIIRNLWTIRLTVGGLV